MRGTLVFEADEDDVPTNRFLGRDADDLAFGTDLSRYKRRSAHTTRTGALWLTHGPASALMMW